MMRRMRTSSFLLACGLSALAAGCGDDTTTTGGAGAAGGTGGTGGDGGDGGTAGNGGAGTAVLESARAPDEYTVVAQVDGSFAFGPPSEISMYKLTSLVGEIDVIGTVEYDAAANTLTLQTEKQKLGVQYTLTVKAPGNELDLKFANFLSADTATFWATDFANDFADYQVVARREAVGDNVVIYATPEAEDAMDLDQTVAIFDAEIFPITTGSLAPAPDQDENEKILLLGLDGNGFYGGYFNPINSISDEQAQQFGRHSNEMDMLYISVPDCGDNYLPYQVVAHEFSHLLYNEQHDFSDSDWSWHNEGLAECTVHLVTGQQNQYAIDTYFAPGSDLASGQSLMIWQYSNYDQYAQAYMFWTYLASRMGGTEAFGELFDVSGNPNNMSAFLEAELGSSLSELQLEFMTAVWVDAPTGPHGFAGLIDLPGKPATLPSVPADLLPFTGVFIDANANDVLVAGQGPDVVHRGVTSSGATTDASPYDAQGGILLALNTDNTFMNPVEQSSGTYSAPNVSPLPPPAASPAKLAADRAWMHPPPVKPANLEALYAWRKRAHGF